MIERAKKLVVTPNSRKSISRRKSFCSSAEGEWIPRRGSSKYFIFIQVRYQDIFVYIYKGVIFPPKLGEGFERKDLLFAEKNKESVILYLKSLSLNLSKKIVFSLNSLNIGYEEENLQI